MKPVPIPDKDIWSGANRMTIGAPQGLEEQIRPVEVLVDRGDPEGAPRFNILLELEEGDLEKLAENPRVWLSLLGTRLQPFSLSLDADR